MTFLAQMCAANNALNWPEAIVYIASIAAVAFVAWVIFR